jgi:hypothetical protein
MNSDNIIEQRKPKPVIARRKGELGAVMVDPKTGKPIPDTWVTKAKVPEKALKYLDPVKFAAAEQRNKDRQAQIDAEKERLKGVGNPPVTQPPAPAAQPPASKNPPVASVPTRRPAPTPETKAVSDYMSASAAARKSGDSAQMAKVRDTGLEIWRKKYSTTLAKNVNPDGTQKGTGQSVMAKQADQLRALRPTPKNNQEETTMNYDAYDLVLEYLFSQGHVDTLEEALYVMMQMDGENIKSIVEGVMPEPIDPTAHKEAQRLARQQIKIRSLEAGSSTSGEQKAAQSKLRGPQLPGV